MTGKKKVKVFGTMFGVYLLFTAWGFRMQTVNYTAESDKIKRPVRIVFISDLHNCFYGRNQSKLMGAVEKADPDIVLFDGDVLDMWGGTRYATEIMEKVSKKYKCAYTPGNHEEEREFREKFYSQVSGMGIPVLMGDKCTFDVNGQKINIFGTVDDLAQVPHQSEYPTQLESCIAQAEQNEYNILLAHQPEQINSFIEGNFDLILSGHAHGGQWRLPFVLEQGLYAPNQGIFPKYTNGKYTYGNKTHIISKGLAKPLRMIFIPRIYNRPEFSVIDIF